MAKKKKAPEEIKIISERHRGQIPLRLDMDILERLRNAVFWLGRGLTVQRVAERATTQALLELEKENGGKPFKQRTESLPRGQRSDLMK